MQHKNNSVDIDIIKNRVDIVLIKNKIKDDESYSGLDKYLKTCSHSTHRRKTIFNENRVAVLRNKKYITLDKLNINGMLIFELSKYVMYDFIIKCWKKIWW